MTAPKLGQSLCGQLVRLALDVGGGRLRQPGMLAIAARSALLLDLASIGAVDTPVVRDGLAVDAGAFRRGTLQVDTTPTGVRSADDLLGYVRRHPNRTVDQVLWRGRPYLGAVTAELVRDGDWSVHHGALHRGYLDADGPRFVALRQRMSILLDGRATPTDEQEAALAAIADVLGLLGPRDVEEPPSTVMLAALGSIGWLGRDIVEYVRVARIRREMSATPWQASDG